MCLSVVKKRYYGANVSKKRMVLAWKVFSADSLGNLQFQSQVFKGVPILDKWNESFSEILTDPSYEVAFHACTSLKGALEYQKFMGGNIIKQVLLNEVVAMGTQNGIACIVARKMFILPDLPLKVKAIPSKKKKKSKG